MLTFPDGAVCTLYEPNFFFCLGTLWSERQLCERAAAAVEAQRQALLKGEVI
jgi:hypothetical protein